MLTSCSACGRLLHQQEFLGAELVDACLEALLVAAQPRDGRVVLRALGQLALQLVLDGIFSSSSRFVSLSLAAFSSRSASEGSTGVLMLVDEDAVVREFSAWVSAELAHGCHCRRLHGCVRA